MLLEKCRAEFQALPLRFEATLEESTSYDPKELEYMLKVRKDKMLACMRLVGNLFLRALVSIAATYQL